MPETLKIIEGKLKAVIDSIYDAPSYKVVVQHDPNVGFKAVITSPDPHFLGEIIGRQGTNLGYLRGLFQTVEKKNGFRCAIWVERFPQNI